MQKKYDHTRTNIYADTWTTLPSLRAAETCLWSQVACLGPGLAEPRAGPGLKPPRRGSGLEEAGLRPGPGLAGPRGGSGLIHDY
jgi:hypothetical protein